jgi:lysophospholipase L1-like esterase
MSEKIEQQHVPLTASAEQNQQTRKRTLLFITSIVLNILMIGCGAWFAAKRGGVAYIRAKLERELKSGERWNNYHETRLSVFNFLPDSTNDIVFLGDSITDIIEWGELMGTPRAKNRGINGDNTSAILHRIEEVVEGKPAKIFLMCGVNNIQGKVPIDRTVSEYRKIVTSILSGSPKTQLYLLSVLPVNVQKYRTMILPEHPGINVPSTDDVMRINREIETICQEHSTVIRIPLLNASGELDERFTYDGLHLNGVGMKALAEAINPFLNGLPREPSVPQQTKHDFTTRLGHT